MKNIHISFISGGNDAELTGETKMSNVVTLYKISSGAANVPASYALDAIAVDEARGDFSAEYRLPAGYSLGENIIGAPMIFDPQGRGCEVVEHPSGRPQLVSAARQQPVLTLSE